MSESGTPTSNDVLNSLHLLRSDNPADRKRGIAILTELRDDPRVQQVFGHLYENDPDPQVRDLAWRALNQAGPSIPAPTPVAPTRVPAPRVEAPPPLTPVPRKRRLWSRKPDTSPIFLLNPANASFVARESRRRRPRRAGGCLWLLVALALVIVAALLVLMVLPEWRNWYRLNEDGATVEGVVTGRRVEDEDYRGETHIVEYTFVAPLAVPDGVEVAGEQAVSSQDYAALQDGATVNVTYLLAEPDISRIEQADPREEERAWITALAVALVALAFVALGMAFREQKRRAGRLIKGEIVTCTSLADPEGDFAIKLRYRFHAPSGKMIVRQATQIRNDMKATRLPDPGTPVAIYYRNDQSHRLL